MIWYVPLPSRPAWMSCLFLFPSLQRNNNSRCWGRSPKTFNCSEYLSLLLTARSIPPALTWLLGASRYCTAKHRGSTPDFPPLPDVLAFDDGGPLQNLLDPSNLVYVIHNLA